MKGIIGHDIKSSAKKIVKIVKKKKKKILSTSLKLVRLVGPKKAVTELYFCSEVVGIITSFLFQVKRYP